MDYVLLIVRANPNFILISNMTSMKGKLNLSHVHPRLRKIF